ncbi:MAG TPA: hypothetical protein VHS80_16505, partial [Chthoniobacterales bacterium]|nr:hypothetical protein [Chthoniobacterales bacterium]
MSGEVISVGVMPDTVIKHHDGKELRGTLQSDVYSSWQGETWLEQDSKFGASRRKAHQPAIRYTPRI